jgi:putative membrane protein
MTILSNLMVGLVAILHLYFLTMEMFLWTTAGRRAFGLTAEFAEASKGLAANQGLYNGFLAAGLIWGIFANAGGFEFKVFFLGCVIIAGLYGGLTTSRKILWVQTLPGFVALVLVLLNK